MAVFRKGASVVDDVLAQAKRGSGFTPTLFWSDGTEKLIQFITPLEDVIQVGHYSVCVGFTKKGDAIMRDLIDPESIGIEDGYNPIADREWEAGPVSPNSKLAAVAVEIEEVKKGKFEVAYHEYENKKGDTVEEPNVGVVIQGPAFWGWFKSRADRKNLDLTEEVYAVERAKGSSPVKYNTIEMADALELDDEIRDAIKLEDFLEELASPERFHELIDELEDDHILNKWAQKVGKSGGRKSSSKSSRSSSSTRRRSRVDDEEPGDTDDSDAEPDEDDKRAKFNELKDSLTKKRK